jgi:hypothetical protein
MKVQVRQRASILYSRMKNSGHPLQPTDGCEQAPAADANDSARHHPYMARQFVAAFHNRREGAQ